jgi:hypothetical protein
MRQRANDLDNVLLGAARVYAEKYPERPETGVVLMSWRRRDYAMK